MRAKSPAVTALGSTRAAADAEAAGAGFEEALGRGQIDAAGRHQPNLRKRTAKCLEIGRAAESRPGRSSRRRRRIPRRRGPRSG